MKKFVLQREPDPKKNTCYRIPYAELLNDRQYQAVMHQGGPSLVVAGAGTGKTRTLTYRVARLIEDGNPPESILLLTFTRRAAREMLERATGVLDERCSRVKGGTFHHYCNQLLHRYADRIGFPNHFTLLDQADAADVIRYLRTAVVHQLKGKRFPHKHALAAMFSSTVNKQVSLYEVVASEYPQFLEHHDMIEELQKRYSEYKSANSVMDFDDLLVYTRLLLTQEDDICRIVASQNRYVMVDEYQDTNNLQDELTSLFSSVHRDLLVVGDDAQSIYSFRGANFRNILTFPERFQHCQVIKLEENYRSTEPILNLSNTLINKASEKFEKSLFTVKQEGDLPGLVKASSERNQSRFICQLLLQLREQGRALGNMAVLFRNGRDSYDLEWELGKRNIPFQKFGGQKFAEAAHVRDVLAHLRVVVNPEDQVAWNRVLMLLDGIGPQTASELIQWLKRNKEENLADSNIVSRAYKKQLEKLSMALSEVTGFRQYPGKAVESVAAYYQPICEKRHDDHPKRIKDLEVFAGLAGGYASLDQLLQELTLDPLDATAVETEPREKDETPLVLSTIHSAKGLEWDTVFVVQCLDGIIPSGYSVDDPMALDEELRLLYVACTRAREQLFITYPAIRESTYGEYFSNPSRFLEGISERTLEPWLLEEEPARQQLPP